MQGENIICIIRAVFILHHMAYLFAPYLLLREPAGNPKAYRSPVQFFLDDSHFRSALFLATPSFYASLEKLGFNYDSLTKKEVNTLKKYMNRYCFRPTPFGLFASVSLVAWPSVTDIMGTPRVFNWHVSADMNYANLLLKSLVRNAIHSDLTYEKNPSIYRVLQEYRFFRTGLDQTGKQRDFQLQSIAFSKLLRDLILFCETGRSRQDIVAHITVAADCTLSEASDYADFLIDAQLLVTANGRILPDETL